jgi:hypothetical protein
MSGGAAAIQMNINFQNEKGKNELELNLDSHDHLFICRGDSRILER